MSSRRTSHSFQRGSRVEYVNVVNGVKNRLSGVIAYGPGSFHLKPNENDWCGVVLDTPSGKNNGTIQGKKYFECPENCGIFVRSSTLRPLSSLPGLRPANTPSPSKFFDRFFLFLFNDFLLLVSTPNLTPASSVSSISDLAKENSPRMSDSHNPPPVSKLPGPSRLRAPSKLQKTTNSGSQQNIAGSGIAKLSGIPGPASGLSSASSTTSLSSSGFGGSKTRESQPQNVKQMIEKVEHNVEEKIRELSQSEDIARISEPSSPTRSDSYEIASKNREIQELKDKNRDLESKVETLMLKRAEDRQKFSALEKVKRDNDFLIENKRQLMDKNAELKRQKEAAEAQAREAVEELSQQKEDIQDLIDNSEMAVIDKEMAENRVEQLQIEVETLKEQLEESKIDFELLKSEIEDKGVDGAANSFQIKQLEEQNQRYKEALLKLRDISVNDRQSIEQLKKELESKISELSLVIKDNQTKSVDIEKYKGYIEDLTVKYTFLNFFLDIFLIFLFI